MQAITRTVRLTPCRQKRQFRYPLLHQRPHQRPYQRPHQHQAQGHAHRLYCIGLTRTLYARFTFHKALRRVDYAYDYDYNYAYYTTLIYQFSVTWGYMYQLSVVSCQLSAVSSRVSLCTSTRTPQLPFLPSLRLPSCHPRVHYFPPLLAQPVLLWPLRARLLPALRLGTELRLNHMRANEALSFPAQCFGPITVTPVALLLF